MRLVCLTMRLCILDGLIGITALTRLFCMPRRAFRSLTPPGELHGWQAGRNVRAATVGLRHDSLPATAAPSGPGSVVGPLGRTCVEATGSRHHHADLYACVISRHNPARWEAQPAQAGEMPTAQRHAPNAADVGRRARCSISLAPRIPRNQVSCTAAATQQTTAISWAVNGKLCMNQNTRTQGARQPGTGIRRTAGAAAPSPGALANASTRSQQ